MNQSRSRQTIRSKALNVLSNWVIANNWYLLACIRFLASLQMRSCIALIGNDCMTPAMTPVLECVS